jgi:hypothetical protein
MIELLKMFENITLFITDEHSLLYGILHQNGQEEQLLLIE